MRYIKKSLVCILVILMFSANSVTYAASVDEENVIEYETEFQNEESKLGETQKVILKFDAELDEQSVDLENSYIEIIGGDEEKKYYSLELEDGMYFFKFIIDDSFGLSPEWSLLSVHVLSTKGLKFSNKSKDSFTIVFDRELETNPITKESNGNEENGSNISAPITNNLEVSGNNLIDANNSAQNMKLDSPSVSNISIKQGNGNYTISANISGGIKKILIPTWTDKNGQDDITWEQGVMTGNSFSYTVDMWEHKNETGVYISHIYLYDFEGNSFVTCLQQDMKYSGPELSNIKVTEGNGIYTITANISSGIDRVLFPTWTDRNGQDDIIWGLGKIDGNTVTYTVRASEHKGEVGDYTTHVYAYDKLGKSITNMKSVNMKYSKPVISNITTSSSGGKTTISARVTGGNISKVLFPTWTNRNGQDDLVWHEGVIEGEIASYTVDMKDHRFESGLYFSHIYVYDELGNLTTAEKSYNITNAAPQIEDIKVEKGNGKYKITAKISDDYGISKVLFPTWTDHNGQDDLVWHEGKVQGNVVTIDIEVKDHKYEIGNYITHIYAYDKAGLLTTSQKVVNMEVMPPELKNIKYEVKSGKCIITAEVNSYAVNKVLFPTWTTKNGQNDIYWGEGNVQGNVVSYTVDVKDHGFEIGEYLTHIYVYDAVGNVAVSDVSYQMNISAPVISNIQISDVSSQGYLVTADISDSYGIDKVIMPTWSFSNGQDDITWQQGTIVGNRLSYRVYVKDHKYNFGKYQTHIYAYNKAGLLTSAVAPIVDINSSSNAKGWNIVNGNKYFYDANGVLVDGSKMLIIDVSEHNGKVNWENVKNAGVDGVILRSSYGYDYSNGFQNSQMDKEFKRNVSELERLGIPYGIYHFTYARYVGEGAEEAKYLLDCLKEAGAKPSLPIYYDLESSSYVGEKSNDFYTKITKEFANVISSAGYSVGVYANYNWWSTKLTDSSFNNYIKWVAHYGTDANNAAGTANPYWHAGPQYKMWQYSSQGSVNGIGTNVDMNVLFDW